MSQTWAHSAREMDNCACVRTIGSCRQRIGELRKARSVLIGAIELSREIGDELTQITWYCSFSALASSSSHTRSAAAASGHKQTRTSLGHACAEGRMCDAGDVDGRRRPAPLGARYINFLRFAVNSET